MPGNVSRIRLRQLGPREMMTSPSTARRRGAGPTFAGLPLARGKLLSLCVLLLVAALVAFQLLAHFFLLDTSALNTQPRLQFATHEAAGASLDVPGQPQRPSETAAISPSAAASPSPSPAAMNLLQADSWQAAINERLGKKGSGSKELTLVRGQAMDACMHDCMLSGAEASHTGAFRMALHLWHGMAWHGV